MSENSRVMCKLCPNGCALAEGQVGACKARIARGGRVVAENYGRVTSVALDPIEKKPIACWNPGSYVLSVGSYGCNLHCPWCQNDSISQANADEVPWREIAPEVLVEAALKECRRGNIGIAYTYNEPLVGYEFVLDTARLAHEAGLKNVLVSNGMINPEPLAELAPLIDAANIDLKAFTQGLYDLAGGDLETVKATIAALAAEPNCHLEVTTLVIPGLNDSEEEIAAEAQWLAELDPGIVYHLSRFFPQYRMVDRPPTPVSTVYRLADVARRFLPTVLTGNC